MGDWSALYVIRGYVHKWTWQTFIEAREGKMDGNERGSERKLTAPDWKFEQME